VRDEPAALAEVPEDRSGFCERAPVVEDQGGHVQCRVQVAEHVATVRAIHDVDLAQLERQAEMRAQQPDLVTVAGDRAVVQEHAWTLHGGAE
jgi:hypothetical protein